MILVFLDTVSWKFFLNHCFRIPSDFWKFDCFLILKPLKTILTFSRLNIAVAHWSSIQICSNYWARELKLREFAKLSIFFFFYFYPPTHYCITCICIIVDWIFLNTVKYVIKRFFKEIDDSQLQLFKFWESYRYAE